MKSKAEVMRDLARVRRRKLIVQKKETITNQYGDTVTDWNDWRKLRVEKSDLWGSEYYAALADGEEKTVEFVVRHVAFLDELKTDTHRIIYEGDTYDIKHIDHLKDDGMWIKLKVMRRQ